jgi:prepilin-type N-terminal cleavage/methylation domain-containing protein
MTHGSEDGFTFNELLAAMAIVVVVVMGYSLSSVNLIRRQIVSDNSTVAIHLAQDKIEELQARLTLTDGDFCPAGGDHALSPKIGVAGIFDRCWRIVTSSLGSALKEIHVTVSWRDHEAHELTLSTLVFTGE